MDYQATDRDMSCWVLSCLHNRTRFYLSESGTYTDRLSNARRFRWIDQAEAEAAEHSEAGFALKPLSVAAAFSLATR